MWTSSPSVRRMHSRRNYSNTLYDYEKGIENPFGMHLYGIRHPCRRGDSGRWNLRYLDTPLARCCSALRLGIQTDGGSEMSNYKPPRREDFDTEEDYLEWLEAYEAAIYLSELMDEESRYMKKQ